jgi:hypothetical protein
VKPSLIIAGVAACALSPLSACQLQFREPEIASTHTESANSAAIDPNEVFIPIHPKTPGADASSTSSFDNDADASSAPIATHKPSGQLSCQSVFCPVETDPAVVTCCTQEADVTARGARLTGRCGVDLSVLDAASFGDRCWQRDQLGIVDERCTAHGDEPGCCADDGTCGTFEADHYLGCRHAPGSQAKSCDEPATPTTAGCSANGTYGLRLLVDVVWGGNSGFFAQLTEAARAQIVVHARLNVTGVSARSDLQVSGRLCGVTLPAFYSPSLCEAYVPSFDPQLWDAPMVAPLELSGHYTCDAGGCRLSLDPTTHLLGVKLANADVSWPTAEQTQTFACPAGTGAKCFPDQDQDTFPGILVKLATTGTQPTKGNGTCADGYRKRGSPLSEDLTAIIDGVRRTDRLELGTRLRFGGSARFADDCNRASGSGLAEYVNSRAVGCLVEQGTSNVTVPTNLAVLANTPCEPNEQRFVDQNMPTYRILAAGATPNPELKIPDMTPSRGPALQLLRMGPENAAVSCEQVRAAQY